MTITASRVFGEPLRPGTYRCGRCGRVNACHQSRPKPPTCRACALDYERDSNLPDQGWAQRALCAQVGPAPWFPAKGAQNRAAKAVCGRCPVRAACLAFALTSGVDAGVWGGLSAAERRALGGVAS